MFLMLLEQIIKEDGFIYVSFSFYNAEVVIKCSSMDLILHLFENNIPFKVNCKGTMNTN